MKAMQTYERSKGVYFDLLPMYHDLNRRFFNGTITAQLSWGMRRKAKEGSKRSIRLGSYHPHSKTILINPCLDQAIVPAICVERILFHEMLHQHLPAKRDRSGKQRMHYPEFYDYEKKYPYLREADGWIKANLPRLLAY